MNDLTSFPLPDTYCPNFSDMTDEVFGFFDYFNEKTDPTKNDEEDAKPPEPEFGDFIGSSINSSQSESQSKANLHLAKNIVSSSKNTLIVQSSCSLNEQNVSCGNTDSIYPKPPDKADDEFWDFLKIRSPIKNFQEVFETYATPLVTPMSCTKSFSNLTEDSGFQSADSLNSTQALDNYDTYRMNSQSRHQYDVSNRKLPRTNPSKLACNTYDIKGSGMCTTSTPKSSNKVNAQYISSKHPEGRKSKLTDEEFWDFLNCDTPIVKFSDALKEVKCASLNPEQTLLPNKAIYEESPFAPATIAAETAMPNSFSYVTTQTSVDEKYMKYDTNATSIKHSRKIHDNKQGKTTKTRSSEYFVNAATNSPMNETFNAKSKVNEYSSFSYSNRDQTSLFSETETDKVSSTTKLPCISSVFSISQYPDWVTGVTQPKHSTYIQPITRKEQTNSSFIEKQIQGNKILVEEKQEYAKRNKSFTTSVSSVKCSQSNVRYSVDTSDSKVKSASGATNVNSSQFKQASSISQPTISSVTSLQENAAMNNSKNLYLILPQNQNGSQYLLVLNNVTDLGKPLTNKDASLSNTNLKKAEVCSSTTTGLNNANKTNYLLNIPVSNCQIQPMSLNPNAMSYAVSGNDAKHRVLNRNTAKTDPLITSNIIKCSNVQPQHFSTVCNASNIHVSSNILFSLSGVSNSTSTSNKIVSHQSAGIQNTHQYMQKPLVTLNSRTIPPKPLRPLAKPIKSITLGKDRNAILQTSIPLTIQNVTENKHLCDAQGNVINYFYDSKVNCSPSQSKFSSHNIIDNVNDKLTKVEVNETNEQKFMEQSACSKESISINNLPKVTQSKEYLSSVKDVNQVKNTSSTDQSKKIINANGIQLLTHTVMPGSINNSILSSNNSNAITTNANMPCSSKSQANNYVQIKVAPVPANSKSLSNLQDLFPPPISMVPVSVVPGSQTSTSQRTAPKVLILKSIGQQKIYPKLNVSTKSTEKPKKTGRKTVRELLEERQQIGQRSRKDIRVLRPVQKIPTSSALYQANITNNKYTNVPSFGVVGNINYQTQDQDISKRPNILMLPSANKVMKKNMVKDESAATLKVKEQEVVMYSPNIEVSRQDPTSYRPRHYDMSELQIGYFKVDDDLESCGRFRSKFKVIFSKRQFLYEFPVCRCNQIDLRSSDIWDQMVRIVVAFKILTSMDLGDQTIYLHINCPPLIYLGRLQPRSGVISNAVIYDTPVESDSAWGNVIRGSFIHKIVLRKRQVHKLKTLLYQFDNKFITLVNNSRAQGGTYHSNSILSSEISPSNLKRSYNKNKKPCIRRLPQWDSSEQEDGKIDDDIDMLKPQMCSCRISCRSVRCSCAKSAKSCSSVCMCVNCGNPLNVLESIGIDVDLALEDRCLFQNIYRIPNLLDFLLREIKLSCCNTLTAVRDCIPGTVLCPNVNCNAQLEFSWCRAVVCYPERNHRNHCSLCGQCCFSNGQHCMVCNRCYEKSSSKDSQCPTCKEKIPSAYDGNFDQSSIYQNTLTKESVKISTKPEIIILDAYSVPENPEFSGQMEWNVETTEGDMNTFQGDVDTTKEQMDTSKEEVHPTKEDVDAAKEYMNTSKDVHPIKEDASKECMDTSKEHVDTKKEDVHPTKEDVDVAKEHMDTSQELIDVKDGVVDQSEMSKVIKQELMDMEQCENGQMT
ncbi:hypothetical protein JTE90_020901 [Oedothorax gibbosus]|uniref:Tesmin/TSO1-like CXC domain-containing protein n=1 Tax=Oedothorax gibbosus TaxID=931172 RepID=A0AAV6VQD6_9ARAC|nr:hypothetical protein JTE90_020901 [Oedothorax gibbosus]